MLLATIVIGNNIATSATYGFKSGTASFADMFAGSKVGLGVKVAGITQDFTDGTTTNTVRGLDVAISQNGFFRLVDSNGSVFYSRNGQFKLASFADMFAGSKVGLGVKVAGITQDFTDGTTTNTGRGLDVAISQKGFLLLVESNGSVF